MNENSNTAIPLNDLINTARFRLKSVVTDIVNETNMPAYLLDGIMCEMLSDIRKRELEEFYISVANKEDVMKT